MFRSSSLAVLAAASLVAFGGVTAATTAPAEAGWRKDHYGHQSYYQGGQRGYYYKRHNGGNAALGIAAGVLAIGALAAAASPAYSQPSYGYEPQYGYQPSYGYQQQYGYAQPVYYAPRCHVRHRTVWDPYYGYVSQPVRVCR